ncbi:MAG: DedA family protein [Microscillaceae bacterium]|nr:DedA family protein [Microscillaceae bacterium]MDW8461494.1 DedA family protein [Cytophagales bacterium]
MEFLSSFIDFFLHLDKHIGWIIQNYGTLTYLILFLIIFAETGLVVTPFLPGDSLLFVIGAFAAKGDLNLALVMILLFTAAVLGDTVNYWIGNYIGPKVFEQNYKLLKKEYLERTQIFYEKHGGKTIIFARFIPIIRTFAPFVAGVGTMNYPRFIFYNVIGGAVWIVSFILLGYFFAEIPMVKKNFTLVIFAIILISVLPAVFEYLKNRKKT